jgi:hypothetical protein
MGGLLCSNGTLLEGNSLIVSVLVIIAAALLFGALLYVNTLALRWRNQKEGDE